MPIRPSQLNRFQLTIPSHAISQAQGQLVTALQNAYGSYAQVIPGAAVTDDAYELWVNVTTIGLTAVARDALAKVGIDPLGGTAFTDVITELEVGSAGNVSGGGPGLGGIWYKFPLLVKAGSSIGVCLAVNNATPGTGNAIVVLKCRPTHPEQIRTGRYVRTFGAVTATSSGTTVIPGTLVKGAWTQIGTTTEPLWSWNLGIGMNQAVQNNNALAFDLAIGDATTKIVVVQDQLTLPSTAEVQAYISTSEYYEVPSGLNVYARGVGNGFTSGWSCTAYGVGG